MKKLALLVAAAGALTLSACETATPYQPLLGPHVNHTSGGFSEQQLEPNRWLVTFSGNTLTDRQRVERYLLYRAADLTVQNRFDWFTTLDRNTERKTSVYGGADPFGYGGFGGFGGYGGYGGYWSPSFGLYRRGFGWGYGYGGFGGFGGFGYGGGFGGYGGGAFDLQEVSRYSASAEIVMGHGAKPANDPRAFDARSVIQHVGPTIQLPTPR